MLKRLNSEQLEVAIDENPTCTTRELNKIFNVSCHMIICREMKRLKSRQMAPHTIIQKSTSNSM
ncbi:unnamed protein product [Hymenolepis diminuta]|uniref:HTH psq-type domain-containing protein n=1 Tax=Hymenolepis diminuta TaxID=6216 RepID=A0A564ZDE1_HYMDI|nr:unnamed protein product [Hymenolepis diminuta]